jgi:hypothetical protein
MRMERTEVSYKEEWKIIREPIEFTLNSSREERCRSDNEVGGGAEV